MLQPLQLQDVSARFGEEIAEMRDFLAKSGLVLDTPESLSVIAARLRSDRTFHRDLTSYIWAAIYRHSGPIGYANLLGLLAVAAAGVHFAADAHESEAHDLLRFVMEAQRSLNDGPMHEQTAPGGAVRPTLSSQDLDLPASNPNPPRVRQGPGKPNRRFVWATLAAICASVLSTGIWLHLRSGPATHKQASVAPIVSVPADSVDVPSAFGTQAASGRVAERPSPAPNRQKDIARSVLRTTAPGATHAMSVPAPPSPMTEAQPSWSTRAPAASAVRSMSTGNSSNGAVPSAVLSKRLGSPLLPAYASAQQDDDAATPHRPRLLRRPPQSTLTDGDAELVAEMKVPAGIAPGGAKSPGTTAAPQGIVRPASLGIMAANVVYSPAPAYPAAASAAHVQGEVKVQATIDRDGNVASARVISGPPLLRDAALDAVQRWRYRPYLAGGKPTSMTALAVMDFQLP